jgi:hypothetical protein
MDRSDRLSLSYVMEAQAQKHVTVNETTRALDALLHATVLSRTVDAEPVATVGEGYILPPSRTGDVWEGLDANTLVVFQDNAWTPYPPIAGMTVYVMDEGGHVVWDGAAWVPIAAGGGAATTTPIFGVNTTADATNKLAVKADAVLHSHDDVTPGSGDARHVLNKATSGNTASHLFQTGYSARAEFGLTGTDDFVIKVSPDGTTFHDAIIIDRMTGAVSFPNTADLSADTSIVAYHVVLAAGQSNMRGVEGNGYDPALDVTAANILQWGRFGADDGTVIPATDPLHHYDRYPSDPNVGPAMAFARALAATLPPRHAVLIVPCADGGTGFSGSAEWAVGGSHYTDAVSRTNAALAAIPPGAADASGNALAAIIWHQGEDSAANDYAAANHASALDAMIAGMRGEITGGTQVPFLLGGLVPSMLGNAAYQQIEAVLADTPNRVAYTAYADAVGLSNVQDDMLHFDAAGARGMGLRLHAVLDDAITNVPPSAPADAPVLSLAGQDATSLGVTWTSVADADAYELAYREAAASTFTSLGAAAGLSRTIGSLAANTSYEVRVRATNAGGDGPWSALLTASTMATGFTPASLFANGEDGAWLVGSANELVQGGTTLARLIDQSGNGYDFTISGTPTGPTPQTVNGEMALAFDGTQRLVNADLAAVTSDSDGGGANSPLSVHMVVSNAAVGVAGVFFGGGTTATIGDDNFFWIGTDPNGSAWRLNSKTSPGTDFGAAASTLTVVSFVSGADGKSWQQWVNGAKLGNARTVTRDAHTHTLTAIGCLGNGGFYWTGTLGEIIVLGRNPSDTEIVDLHAYMMARWSIS